MLDQTYTLAAQLPAGFAVAELPTQPLPSAVLMCPPDEFDVIDVKNPFMEGQIGQVDRGLARRQWEELRETFVRIGVTVHLIEPVKGCEDMVFCANQTLSGLDAAGARQCLLSRMKHPSRQKEVPAFGTWFAQHGYRVQPISELLRDDGVLFEGSGDAIWHPGRALLWGGHGHRSDAVAYQQVAEVFGVPVLTLALLTSQFYHLDTCFCPLDDKTVLCYPPSLTAEGLWLIRRLFQDVILVDQHEAMDLMACNAAAFHGRCVVLQRGSHKTVQALRQRGFEVFEVDTSEYMKSGGSVFCMKMLVF